MPILIKVHHLNYVLHQLTMPGVCYKTENNFNYDKTNVKRHTNFKSMAIIREIRPGANT